MRVQIFSMTAARSGHLHGVQWEGDTDVNPTAGDPDFTNSRLFRLFNRVDEKDGEYLESIGYRLPSLSVGDFVTWRHKTWQITSDGFEKITVRDWA
jgi:hypothetical protein